MCSRKSNEAAATERRHSGLVHTWIDDGYVSSLGNVCEGADNAEL